MLYSLSAYVSNRQEVLKTLSELITLCVDLTLSSKRRTFFFSIAQRTCLLAVTARLASLMSKILLSHPLNRIFGWFLFCCVSVCGTHSTVAVSFTGC